MKRGATLSRYLAAVLGAALLLAGCGGNGEQDPEPEAPTDGAENGDDGDDEGDPEGDDAAAGELSLTELRMSFPTERVGMLMQLYGSKVEWDKVFDSVELTQTIEGVAGLVSDSVWIAMDEPAALWPALESGLVDGVLVANVQDVDNWYLCAAPDIQTPEDLIGGQFTGGEVGNAWNVVGAKIMQEELGIDPAEVEFVSVGGGSDAWVEALLAGQVDAAMCQPRHMPLMEEAGGNLLYQEQVNIATEMFLVMRDTWENHQDAVCAAVGGMFDFRQWMLDSEEDDWSDRMPELTRLLEDAGYDTSEAGLDIERYWETTQQLTGFSWTMTLGTPAEAMDLQYDVLSREGGEGGEISADFDWREHVAYDCVWEKQEAAGLPLVPDPSDI